MQLYMSNEEAAMALNKQLQDRAWNIRKQQIGRVNPVPVINLDRGTMGMQTSSTPNGVQLFNVLGNNSNEEEEPAAKTDNSSSSKNPIIQNNSLSAFNSLLPLLGVGGLAALLSR